jgi:hypothetical protein
MKKSVQIGIPIAPNQSPARGHKVPTVNLRTYNATLY